VLKHGEMFTMENSNNKCRCMEDGFAIDGLPEKKSGKLFMMGTEIHAQGRKYAERSTTAILQTCVDGIDNNHDR